jgi:ATP phosphoribosyltransferase regulatory subunit
MIGRYHWDKQLPHGVADLLFEEAARHRAVEETLRRVFLSWGYSEVIPPTFEYYESLATEAGAQLQEEMYRFFSRDGHTLALRADMTVPVARIVGTKLFDRPLPLRFCYTANVFRYEEPKAGRRHEFTQAGIELIGAPGEQADAEVVALLVEALRALGLPRFKISMGHVGFFKELTRELQGDEERFARLKQAIDAKDRVALSQVLASLNLSKSVEQSLATLLELQGGAEVLEQARAACANPAACAALENLAATFRALQALGLEEYLSFDLGLLRGMEYYTGLLFQVYAPGIGFTLCSGGRYDDLIAHFGPPLPAVGFSMGLERVLLALEHQAQVRVDIAPHLLIAGQPWSEAFQFADAARKRGLRVEVDVLGRNGKALLAYARSRKARRVLDYCQDRWVLVDERGERALADEAVLEEISTWNA